MNEAAPQGGKLSLTITNSTIRDNTASVSGGGLDLTCGTTNLAFSYIVSNQAQLGGGIAFQCGAAVNTTVEHLDIADSSLISNNSAVRGAGPVANTVMCLLNAQSSQRTGPRLHR